MGGRDPSERVVAINWNEWSRSIGIAGRDQPVCANPSGLRKKAGAWHGGENAKPISGVTVADLARDGMLTLIWEHRPCSAQLTERGIWFAQTLLDDGATQGHMDQLDLR
jgi:hypothetical protein